MKANIISAPPRAGALLEALRGLGYSTASALADIVDNSIAAGATKVRIDFTWLDRLSRIAILDNGRGMNALELRDAMTLGHRDPLDERSPTDLGRFGMRWDLDELAKRDDGGWFLFEGAAEGSNDFLEPLSENETGTLVLWESLDRIVTNAYAAEDFFDLIDRVEIHLAMVFHRFLEGPRARLKILLNGKSIAPWDPFMSGHPAKLWASPVQRRLTGSGVVTVECHVLPHRDKLSAKEFEAGAGPEGWNAHQGFFVYRNERLLVAGGWLGLGQGRAWNREEAYRLARISLDIPNSADAAWKIDIRKATAKPPVELRPWLTRIAEDTRERARRVFAFRGSPAPGAGNSPIDPAWRVEHTKAGARYRIDQKHPAIAAALDAAGDNSHVIRAMLRVIEETVPVQRIWLDTAENKDTPQTSFSGVPTAEVADVLRVLFRDMVSRRGIDPAKARMTLSSTEPFQNFPALVAALDVT